MDDDLREGPLDQHLHLPLAAGLRRLGGPTGAYGFATAVLGLAAVAGVLLVTRPLDWLLPAALLFGATVASRARRPRDPGDHQVDLALFSAVWLAFTWRVAGLGPGVFPVAALVLVSALTHAGRHARACRRYTTPPERLDPADARRLHGGPMAMAAHLSPGTHLAVLYAALAAAAFDLPGSFGAAALLIALGLNVWALLVGSAWRRADALAHGLAGDGR